MTTNENDINTKSKVRADRRQINQRKNNQKMHQRADNRWK